MQSGAESGKAVRRICGQGLFPVFQIHGYQHIQDQLLKERIGEPYPGNHGESGGGHDLPQVCKAVKTDSEGRGEP